MFKCRWHFICHFPISLLSFIILYGLVLNKHIHHSQKYPSKPKWENMKIIKIKLKFTLPHTQNKKIIIINGTVSQWLQANHNLWMEDKKNREWDRKLINMIYNKIWLLARTLWFIFMKILWYTKILWLYLPLFIQN